MYSNPPIFECVIFSPLFLRKENWFNSGLGIHVLCKFLELFNHAWRKLELHICSDYSFQNTLKVWHSLWSNFSGNFIRIYVIVRILWRKLDSSSFVQEGVIHMWQIRIYIRKKELWISCVTNRNDHCALREITPGLKHPATGPEEEFTLQHSRNAIHLYCFWILTIRYVIWTLNSKAVDTTYNFKYVTIMAANKTGKQRENYTFTFKVAALVSSVVKFITPYPHSKPTSNSKDDEKKKRKKCQSARNIFVSSSLARKNKSLMFSDITLFLWTTTFGLS